MVAHEQQQQQQQKNIFLYHPSGRVPNLPLRGVHESRRPRFSLNQMGLTGSSRRIFSFSTFPILNIDFPLLGSSLSRSIFSFFFFFFLKREKRKFFEKSDSLPQDFSKADWLSETSADRHVIGC
jgi:hypothetical protein